MYSLENDSVRFYLETCTLDENQWRLDDLKSATTTQALVAGDGHHLDLVEVDEVYHACRDEVDVIATWSGVGFLLAK